MDSVSLFRAPAGVCMCMCRYDGSSYRSCTEGSTQLAKNPSYHLPAPTISTLVAIPPGNAHTMIINEETGFAYAAGTNTCEGGLHMIDIRTPSEPKFLGCFGLDGYTHDLQCTSMKGSVVHGGCVTALALIV